MVMLKQWNDATHGAWLVPETLSSSLCHAAVGAGAWMLSVRTAGDPEMQWRWQGGLGSSEFSPQHGINLVVVAHT